jgi:hypothetical protein
MSVPSHVQSIADLRRLLVAALELEGNWRNQVTSLRLTAERFRHWVTIEQRDYWSRQLLRAERQLASDLEALHRSQITDTSPNKSGTVDAQVRVNRSKQRVRLCEQRKLAVKKWSVEIDRLVDNFLGRINHLSELADKDLPLANSHLANWIAALEVYSETGGVS